VPLGPSGKKPVSVQNPKHFLEIIEKAYSAEVLAFSIIISHILNVLDNDHVDLISRKINETEALCSLSAAISSRKSALQFKENIVSLSAKLLDLKLDHLSLYVQLGLLPFLAQELGKLARNLVTGSFTFLYLHSDVPRTNEEAKKLSAAVQEIVGVSELTLLNLALVNDKALSIHDIPKLALGLESLKPLANISFKPPLPFCFSPSPNINDFPGICPARNIYVTVDAFLNNVPCLYRREPSLPNLDISADSWNWYKDHFARSVTFHALDGCETCQIKDCCGGLCDVWQRS
jgi:hypothetical protein